MKKVYIPTIEELSSMQENMKLLDLRIYQYLLAKMIETLIMEDVMYEEIDMFEVAYDNFAEYPEIIYGIAKLYPERISESKKASNDADLCAKLIPNLIMQDKSIYGLDNLLQFSNDTLKNPEVIKKTINTLGGKLNTYPKYRFDYKEPNNLLDAIFSGEILEELSEIDNELASSLSVIDPIYFIKMGHILSESKDTPEELRTQFIKSYTSFIDRYVTKVYKNPKTLINPNEKSKKLVRYLNNHKKYYQF